MQSVDFRRKCLPQIQSLVDQINAQTRNSEKKIISDFLIREGYSKEVAEIPLNKYIKYLVFFEERMRPYYEQIRILVDNIREEGYDVKIFMQDYTLTLYGIIE